MRMRHARGFGLFLIIAIESGSFAHVAFAQPAPAPVPPDGDPKRQRALALLQAGNALIQTGDYVEALDKFNQAYALVPSPKLLLNIGTTLRYLGRNAQANDTYEQYLKDPDHDPTREAEIKKIIRELYGSTGRVRIVVKTEGASVKLDNKPIGNAPLDYDTRLDPGDHTVVVDKPGMSPAVLTIQVKSGIALALSPEPTPAKLITTTVESGTNQRIAGFVIGGVGVASVAVGGIFGGLALSANNSAKKECSKAEPTICSARGVELGNTATMRATISTATFVSGLGLAALGTILIIAAPSGKKTSSESQPVKTSTGLHTLGFSIAPRSEGGMSGSWIGIF
jgi:PEGA domain